MTDQFVEINDGAYTWIATRSDLVRALDSLGWEKTRTRTGAIGRREPGTEGAYLALSEAVSQAPEGAEPDFQFLALADEDGVWEWAPV